MNFVNTTKIKITRGDTVRVLRGRDRGKQGKVISVIPREKRAIVEGINMVHKHVRPRRAGEKGQRVHVAAPINIANIQLVCPECKQGTRIAVRRVDEVRERICKKCDSVIKTSR